MLAISIGNAVEDFDKACNDVIQNCEPVIITRGNNQNVVLISQSEYNNLVETVYLLGIPGMRAKLSGGIRTPLEKCNEFDW